MMQRELPARKLKGSHIFIMRMNIITILKKRYTIPRNTSIGKCTEDDPEMMYPNNEIPEKKEIFNSIQTGMRMNGTMNNALFKHNES